MIADWLDPWLVYFRIKKLQKSFSIKIEVKLISTNLLQENYMYKINTNEAKAKTKLIKSKLLKN